MNENLVKEYKELLEKKQAKLAKQIMIEEQKLIKEYLDFIEENIEKLKFIHEIRGHWEVDIRKLYSTDIVEFVIRTSGKVELAYDIRVVGGGYYNKVDMYGNIKDIEKISVHFIKENFIPHKNKIKNSIEAEYEKILKEIEQLRKEVE